MLLSPSSKVETFAKWDDSLNHKLGYIIQFHRGPLFFNGLLPIAAGPEALILGQEVLSSSPLERGAIEEVSLSQRESGFYRRYWDRFTNSLLQRIS